MTYTIRSQADWDACMEVLEPGDTVYIHHGFTMTQSDYRSIHGITFIGIGPTPTVTIIDNPPQPPQYHLASPIFCQEVPA